MRTCDWWKIGKARTTGIYTPVQSFLLVKVLLLDFEIRGQHRLESCLVVRRVLNTKNSQRKAPQPCTVNFRFSRNRQSKKSGGWKNTEIRYCGVFLHSLESSPLVRRCRRWKQHFDSIGGEMLSFERERHSKRHSEKMAVVFNTQTTALHVHDILSLWVHKRRLQFIFESPKYSMLHQHVPQFFNSAPQFVIDLVGILCMRVETSLGFGKQDLYSLHNPARYIYFGHDSHNICSA
jgi:hypothetical protein